ncbi:hypothetical protein [Acetanaerobacterium elongatum]|uniref:DUF2190 family protein n=1 Tax=Acetanaerobacterium elongatum TaxID=258515 RepID=A0A1H0ELW2_9FIRM|nr:hypothetical protein [Acetanaerobacterium elongatum]SDN83408.1 hypothetical protein SAMN05192585_13430 [Acetanaerobacterium elongatum]
MNISFEGVNEQRVTFAAAEGTQKGDLVMMSGSGTVAKATDGKAIVGVVKTLRGGIAGVQVSGYVSLPCAETVAVGYACLASNGANAVKAGGAAGRSCLVVEAGTAGGTIGVLLS